MEGKKRYILFVGSLPFKATPDQISAHFAPHPPTQIRLLTDRVTKRPKGFAFLEFDTREALEAGLGKHHTKFRGRVINVELTAGGGGKSENRAKRIKERNERLRAESNKPQP